MALTMPGISWVAGVRQAAPAVHKQVALPAFSCQGRHMNTSDVLQLPLREKLQIMEAIWADLRERADTLEISQDQKALLDKRRAREAGGAAQIMDWDGVKHSIGQA